MRGLPRSATIIVAHLAGESGLSCGGSAWPVRRSLQREGPGRSGMLDKDIMRWWPFKRRERELGDPPDYFREGVELADDGKYHEALTSFRLALRRDPGDPEIMEQMAVVYSLIGMPEEAVKFYEQAIATGEGSAASHYGLAFIYLHEGEKEGARDHLRAFLARPPQGDGAVRHVQHARKTLRELETGESAHGEPEEPVEG